MIYLVGHQWDIVLQCETSVEHCSTMPIISGESACYVRHQWSIDLRGDVKFEKIPMNVLSCYVSFAFVLAIMGTSLNVDGASHCGIGMT